jgi:RNA polymerase sigma-54 factor
MKPGIQLQLGQQLTMTPQLQQAIRLLQLSTLELRQEIQEQLETNPLLELEEDAGVEEHLDEADPDAELEFDGESLSDELGVDADWDDYVGEPTGMPAGEDDRPPEDNTAAAPSLHEHLHWQLNLTPMSALDRAIAWALIEGIDTAGYLAISLDEAAAATRQALGERCPDGFPGEDEILAVLHRIQHFDPPGVAARSLAECLRLQVLQLDPAPEWREPALRLLEQGLERLERGDRAGLRQLLGLSDTELDAVMDGIRGLNPQPGEDLTPPPETEIPDVIVRRQGRRWTAELNPEALPRLGINSFYAGMAGDARSEADNGYLRARLQEARWLLKSLQSRNDTLLRVARRIVEVQQDFFDYGEEAMKPLVLADIAEAVEMHESTISRVTSHKYMATPRGLFELKYFFSSHVGTEGGGECSSTAIRAIIRKLVAAEDARKPLSDNKLAALLHERGIQVARRTIAKYRESLGIPSSSERKQRF